MTTVTVSSKYQIVIPKDARKKLGIVSGTRLQAVPDGAGLRLMREPTLGEIPGLLKGMAVDDEAIRAERDRPVP